MKKMLLAFLFSMLLSSCGYPYYVYPGPPYGGIIDSSIVTAMGNRSKDVFLGLNSATTVVAFAANARDQQHIAAIEAANIDKTVIYYDNNGNAVEAIPHGFRDNCRIVVERVWRNGAMITETAREICSAPPPQYFNHYEYRAPYYIIPFPFSVPYYHPGYYGPRRYWW